jgi:hypothetical protein
MKVKGTRSFMYFLVVMSLAALNWIQHFSVYTKEKTLNDNSTTTTAAAADNPPLVLLRGGGVQVAATNDTSGPWYPSEEWVHMLTAQLYSRSFVTN